jgi:hypothetical protein
MKLWASITLSNPHKDKIMKSDKSTPSMGTSMPAGKTNHPSAEAAMGTSEHPRKSHAEDIQLGEGLEYGEVLSSHNKETVRESAKEDKSCQQSQRRRQEDMENGKAKGDGDCSM